MTTPPGALDAGHDAARGDVRNSVRSSVRDGARDDARDDARDGARDSTREGLGDAAREAARDGAGDAAGDAAGDNTCDDRDAESGLRVVHVAATAQGAHWMYEQLRELKARGHDVSAVIAGAEGTLAPKLAAAGIPYHVLDLDVLTSRHLPTVVRRLLALVRLLRRLRPDVVHYHLFPSIVIGRLAAWLADVPVRFSMSTSPSSLEAPILAEIDAGTAWADTKVIASCEHTRTLYARLGVPADRVELIYYGPDARVFDPSRGDGARVRQALGIAPATPTVGTVAWFYPPARDSVYTPPRLVHRGVKGHDVLLRAVPRVLARVPDATFLLVGDGWGADGRAYAAQLKALAADLGIAHAVRFTGARHDIPDTLAAFDVSVQCSLSENLGGSLESLLMARPLVASAVGGLVDSVRHEETGLLVAPDDPEALADAIIRLLVDRPLAARLAARGRALATERFTLAHTVDALDTLYRTHARQASGTCAPSAAPTLASASASRSASASAPASASTRAMTEAGARHHAGECTNIDTPRPSRERTKAGVAGAPPRTRGYRLHRMCARAVVLSIWIWVLILRLPRGRRGRRGRRAPAIGAGTGAGIGPGIGPGIGKTTGTAAGTGASAATVTDVGLNGRRGVRVVHVADAQNAAWLVSICRLLREQGYDAEAVIGTPDGALAAGLREAGVPYHCVPLSFARQRGRSRLLVYLVRLPVALVRLVRLFRHERVDIVHTHIFNSILIGRIAAWLARVPHRVAMVPGPLHLEAPFTRGADRLTWWMDHRVIAGCEWTRDRYRALGMRAPRLECIEYGADAARFDPARADPPRIRRELGIAADVPLVGLVAWFYPPRSDWQTPPFLRGRGLKGQEAFLAAARIIHQRIPTARFLLVGGASSAAGARFRERLIASCRDDTSQPGLADAVIFTGARDDVPDILAAVDVAVQCSLSENFGGTIEALLMERPTVATRVGGMPETVRDGETGLLVPPANPPALAAAILQLLEDPRRAREMARAGRRLMLERFQIAHTAASIAALYDRLLDRPPRATGRTRESTALRSV